MTFKEMCDKYGCKVTICDAVINHDGLEIRVDFPKEDWHYRKNISNLERALINNSITFEHWVCDDVLAEFANYKRTCVKEAYTIGVDMSRDRDISVATEFKVVNNRYVNVKSNAEFMNEYLGMWGTSLGKKYPEKILRPKEDTI